MKIIYLYLFFIFISSVFSQNILEINSLNDLYYSLEGDGWINNDNWLVGKPCTNNWYGIICEKSHVISVNLMNNHLEGTLPITITDLTHLKYLYLHNEKNEESNSNQNFIKGSIPENIYKLSKLEIINLSNLEISGLVPDTLFSISSLKSINLYNFFHIHSKCYGIIGDSICNLKNLIEFNIGYQKIESVPDCLFLMSTLEHLDLEHNFLTRNISNLTIELPNLKTLYLNSNKIIGNIPESIFSLTELETLNLQNTLISGTLSPSINKLTKLTTLSIYSTYLEGEIPETINDLKNLQYLNLWNNQLESTIPELVDLTSLIELNLSKNFLNGSIPDYIYDLCNNGVLKKLDLSNNAIKGELKNIETTNELTSFFVQKNFLSGCIPELFQCKQYDFYIDLSFNQFNCPVPSWCSLSAHESSLCEPCISDPNNVCTLKICDNLDSISEESDDNDTEYIVMNSLLIIIILSLSCFGLSIIFILFYIYFVRNRNIQKSVDPNFIELEIVNTEN